MDNSQRLNELFNQARNEEPKTSFEDTKTAFNTSLKKGGGASKTLKNKINLGSFKNLLIMAIGVVIVGAGLFFLMNGNENAIISVENETKELSIDEREMIEKVEGKKAQVEAQYIIKKQLVDLKRKGIIVEDYKEEKRPVTKKVKTLPIEEEEYKFPVLTQEEIETTLKHKRKMLGKKRKVKKGKWIQSDPYGFLFIPMGSASYKEKDVSVQAFYMKQTEVRNFEYRTFLFDLLIQGRKEEFLIAKPNQAQWTKFNKNLKPMEMNYFSHPAYDEYPVVNISREGAKMYCKWFTAELQKNNPNLLVNDIRLPTIEEWVYAAKGGKEKSPYPWGGPYLRNSKGCFLANFKPGIVKSNEDCNGWHKLKDKKANDSLNNYIQTADDEEIPKNHWSRFTADGGYYTVKVSSYNPNDYGLYCMSGNVAEMVINSDDNTAVAKGGSWNSIGQHLQIDAEDLFVGVTEPNVEIGFRPVITYLGESSTNIDFKPFGAKRVGAKFYMDETEVTNFSWKEYLSWIEIKEGKTSEAYKAAYPDTNVWSKHLKYQAPYDEHYFTHVAYNNYPVVGVSYDQAVAFCKWRTDRVKEYIEVNNIESFPKNFSYRLPTKEEWEKVAEMDYSEKMKRILEGKHKDSSKSNLKRGRPTDGSELMDNADVTAPVKSYWPNKYGIYNLTGNVAEMIQERGIAKGGSWIHTEEETTIENNIKYTKNECWLGFRCVFVAVD